MKVRVVVGSQVRAFIASLAPEPRRRLWRSIKELAGDKGDIKPLEANLAPFRRLRVNNMRVIFDEKFQRGERVRFCFFADYRPTVYIMLEQLIASELLDHLKN